MNRGLRRARRGEMVVRLIHTLVVPVVVLAVSGIGPPADGWVDAKRTTAAQPRMVVWENDGPVPVPVGNARNIGSLHLAAGSWAVFAKLGVIVTQSSGNNGVIRCRLRLGAG